MVFSSTSDFIPLGQHDDNEEEVSFPPYQHKSWGAKAQVSWLSLGLVWILSMTVVALSSLHFGRMGKEVVVMTQETPAFPLIEIYKKLPFNPQTYGLRAVNTIYPEPLGKDILILDVDSRGWDAETALEKDEDGLSRARLNHYLYGMAWCWLPTLGID